MTLGSRTVDGLLLDMDGVLTVSWEPLPGAVAAFARLRAAGLPIRLLTNHPRKIVALEGFGIEVVDQIPLGH